MQFNGTKFAVIPGNRRFDWRFFFEGVVHQLSTRYFENKIEWFTVGTTDRLEYVVERKVSFPISEQIVGYNQGDVL